MVLFFFSLHIPRPAGDCNEKKFLHACDIWRKCNTRVTSNPHARGQFKKFEFKRIHSFS